MPANENGCWYLGLDCSMMLYSIFSVPLSICNSPAPVFLTFFPDLALAFHVWKDASGELGLVESACDCFAVMEFLYQAVDVI